MLVHVEAVGQDPSGRVWVRARSQIGIVAALWKGGPAHLGGQHYVEWAVDEDIVWLTNTWPASSTVPELRDQGDRIVCRGQLHLAEDGAAFLDVGAESLLFDLADPPPPHSADAMWVEVRVARDSVSLWPYDL